MRADSAPEGQSGIAGWTVGALETVLLRRFPSDEAEEWDRTGLLVGDPSSPAAGVAVALDATVRAVRSAVRLGANVLVTHHPAYLDPPARISPAGSGAFGPGTVVWEAVRTGIALMNFHTALDASEEAAAVLPGMLGLELRGIVDVRVPRNGHGYGQLCDIPAAAGMTAGELAARALRVFGRQPRIWGDAEARIRTAVTCTGSQSGLARICVASGYDALVCGEVRYHDALDAAEAGLVIVELGHDVSELPLCGVLASSLRDAGFPESAIAVLDQNSNWATPDLLRK